MFHNRRFACAILGAWLGAGVSVDLLVTQNFSAVDKTPARLTGIIHIRQPDNLTSQSMLINKLYDE